MLFLIKYWKLLVGASLLLTIVLMGSGLWSLKLKIEKKNRTILEKTHEIEKLNTEISVLRGEVTSSNFLLSKCEGSKEDVKEDCKKLLDICNKKNDIDSKIEDAITLNKKAPVVEEEEEGLPLVSEGSKCADTKGVIDLYNEIYERSYFYKKNKKDSE